MKEPMESEEADYRLNNLAYALAFDLDEYDKECSMCQGRIVYDDHKAELVCSKCGYVVRERIETMRQREFLDGQLIGSSQASPMYGAKNKIRLSVRLGKTDVDGKPVNDHYWHRLRRLDKHAMCNAAREKTTTRASFLIQTYAEQLGLPDPIIETAMHLFVKVNERKLCKGRVTANFALACIYHSCKMHNAVRTWQELVDVLGSRYDQKITKHGRVINLGKYYSRGVRRAILLVEQELKLKSQIIDMNYYINRVVNEFPEQWVQGKRDKLFHMAFDLWSKVKDEQVMIGKNPGSITAAAIYIAGLRLKLPKLGELQVANSCKISIVSMRKRCKDFYHLLNLTDVPNSRRDRLVAFESGGNGNV